MRLAESPWLTDENIHPEVVAHLRSRGLDVVDVKEQGWQGRLDEEILDAAYRAGRIVLTRDGDCGTIALLGGQPVVGVVRIRPGHIRSDVIIRTLERLLELVLDPSPPFLIVARGDLVRLRTWG